MLVELLTDVQCKVDKVSIALSCPTPEAPDANVVAGLINTDVQRGRRFDLSLSATWMSAKALHRHQHRAFAVMGAVSPGDAFPFKLLLVWGELSDSDRVLLIDTVDMQVCATAILHPDVVEKGALLQAWQV